MGAAHLVGHEEELLLKCKLDDILDALPALDLTWRCDVRGLGGTGQHRQGPSPGTGWVLEVLLPTPVPVEHWGFQLGIGGPSPRTRRVLGIPSPAQGSRPQSVGPSPAPGFHLSPWVPPQCPIPSVPSPAPVSPPQRPAPVPVGLPGLMMQSTRGQQCLRPSASARRSSATSRAQHFSSSRK